MNVYDIELSTLYVHKFFIHFVRSMSDLYAAFDIHVAVHDHVRRYALLKSKVMPFFPKQILKVGNLKKLMKINGE